MVKTERKEEEAKIRKNRIHGRRKRKMARKKGEKTKGVNVRETREERRKRDGNEEGRGGGGGRGGERGDLQSIHE